MSLNNIPSKAEVMGWNPQSLADYMRKLKLSGCDKVVMKSSITGAQFTQMTECDLQVFPSLYVSLITKIQSDMNKGEQMRIFGQKSKAQTYPKQVFAQDEEVWNSDEFDNDSEYEEPPENEADDSDISALTEPQTDEQNDGCETDEEEYEAPPSADNVKPPRHPRAAKPKHGHYRDPVHEPSPAERVSKLLQTPKITHTLPRPFKAPAASQPDLHIDRSRKPGQPGQPGQPGPSEKGSKKSKGSTVKASASFIGRRSKPKPPKPAAVSDRASKPIPAPPVPTQRATVKNSVPGSREGLDPSWYGGKVTRHQAEAALREVNKDGAFVVRDSSGGSTEHPFTLMLLKQGRVYNIKIRNQGNSFSLGTGHNSTKSFPGVTEMITHHTHTPLLLIDATDQSGEAHSQCCLLHPAGL